MAQQSTIGVRPTQPVASRSTDRTLVQIRERSYLEVLDLALVVVRQWPLTLGLAALAGIAPFAAFNVWLVSDPEVPVGVLVYLLVLEAPWATAPLTVVLGGLMFGDRPSMGRVVRTLARSFPSLFLFQLLARAFLMVTFFFYFLVPTRLAFLDEVILLERGKWWSAARRSVALCGHRGGELFGQWLAQLVFGGWFVLCFWLGSGQLVRALTRSELTWDEPEWSDLRGIRAHLGIWLSIAFFGVARFLSYIDQRIRQEGWEVELRLREVGRSLEDSRRW